MTEVATLTIGTDTFSVYGLTSAPLTDANSYFAGSLYATEFTSATDDNKKRAIVTAFRMIERERWTGEKLDPAQTTEWGRTGATKNGVVVDDGIPVDIVNGQFELALYLLKDAALQTKTSTASNVKVAKAGSAQVEFFYPLPGSERRWPLPVHDLLAPYLEGSTSTVSTPYASGNVESIYSSDDYGRSEGFA